MRLGLHHKIDEISLLASTVNLTNLGLLGAERTADACKFQIEVTEIVTKYERMPSSSEMGSTSSLDRE